MSTKINASRIRIFLLVYVFLRLSPCLDDPLSSVVLAQTPTSNWNGMLRSDRSLQASEGTILLESGTNHYSTAVNAEGAFSFQNLTAGLYSVTVAAAGHSYRCGTKVSIPSAATSTTLTLGRDGSVEIANTEIGKVTDTDQLTIKA